MLIPKIPASSFVSLHVSPFICLPACWLPKSLPLLVSLLHLSAFICLPACWFPKPPFFICLPSFVSLLGSSNRKKPRVTLFSSETLSGVYAGIIHARPRGRSADAPPNARRCQRLKAYYQVDLKDFVWRVRWILGSAQLVFSTQHFDSFSSLPARLDEKRKADFLPGTGKVADELLISFHFLKKRLPWK